YMWEQACRCLRMWIDGRGVEGAPRLSVNLSRADIYRSDLCTYLKGLVERYDVPAELLHLEITESAYMEAPEQLIGAVTKLHAAGFVVEMDDFGSGYSSLNMLKDLNVDVLKLDMKLLDVEGSQARKGKSILESIITMARLVDLRVIAEGVETEEQRDFLMRAGCLYAQGYYFY
ncbi:EAL domain-containing protein, partial [Alistipes onderdonkii]|nr:EAL domain-containing protein [Alistipes onderdonkii]